MKASDVKITSRKPNALLGREEILFEAQASGATPRRKDLRQALAAIAGCDEGLVAVSEIRQGFGSKAAKGRANVYKSKEAMEKIEPGHILGRDRGMKKKAGEQKESAPAKEEKPAVKEKGAPAKEEKPAVKEKGKEK